MRIALVVLAVLAVAGCARPKLAKTHPARPTVEVNGPVRWIDRDNGVVELRFECRETTIEVWCRGERNATCESKRVLSDATACPGDDVTITTAWGTTAHASVAPDGRATFTVDVMTAPWRHAAAPGPSDGWQVERDGLALTWRVGTKVMVEAERPVRKSPVRRPQRSYAGTMFLVDLPIFLTAYPAIREARDRGDVEIVAGVYLAAYLLSGPIVHGLNGNSRQIPASLGRRIGVPALGLMIGGLLGGGIGGLLAGGIGAFYIGVYGGILGGGVGVLAGAGGDWSSAHVDVSPGNVTPAVTADRDRVMFGAAGLF